MTMPPVDLVRTNVAWIRVQTRNEVWCNMPRESVTNAAHNVRVYGTAQWLGWKLDESDVTELFNAMDGAR